MSELIMRFAKANADWVNRFHGAVNEDAANLRIAVDRERRGMPPTQGDLDALRSSITSDIFWINETQIVLLSRVRYWPIVLLWTPLRLYFKWLLKRTLRKVEEPEIRAGQQEVRA